MGASLGFSQPGTHPQREARNYTEAFTDQHGRTFGAQFDKQNLKPIGELIPIGYNPPWLMPMRYIKWGKWGFSFQWDYETFAGELAAAASEYYDDVTKFMMEHLPHDAIPRVGDPVPKRVRQVLGPPPLSPAVPLAAQAGDPWILGVPGAQINEKLRECLYQVKNAGAKEALDDIKTRLLSEIQNPVPTQHIELVDDPANDRPRSINTVDVDAIVKLSYKEFLAGAMKGGMSMAEAAEAWAAHKAALAADGEAA